jgi:signal transduction histidine kinase
MRLALRLTPPELRGRGRMLMGLLAAVSIALLGAADYLTTLSLAVFYVIPITIATMAIGAGPSYLLAVEGALVFALSQGTHSGSPPLWVPIANGVFRVLAYGLVVFFVSALRGFADAAQASEQRSRDFLATASHQLRTPVGGILVSAEALTVEADEQVRRRLATNLAAEATRLGRLVANLLRTTRLDQGQTMDLRSVDLAALCEDQVDVFRERVPGLHIAVSAGANVQPALADPQLIDEALANLLDNACRHARSQVAVTVESGADVVITVRDDGPGLPAGSEQRVFERFVSLDSAGGAGLGLPIARALCRAQGGDVEWSGAEFVIRLPAFASSGPQDVSAAGALDPRPCTPSRSHRGRWRRSSPPRRSSAAATR